MRAQKPELVTAPATPLVSIDEVKEYLRLIPHDSDEDTLLEALVSAAEATLDGYGGLLGRAVITQTWKQKLSDFPDGERIPIAFGAVQEVTEVAYIDESGVTRTFSEWHLVNEPIGPSIALRDNSTWPIVDDRPDAVTISWTAGYGDDVDDVPAQFRVAALQLIGHWYLHREPVSVGASAFEVPWSLKQTISAMRAFGG